MGPSEADLSELMRSGQSSSPNPSTQSCSMGTGLALGRVGQGNARPYRLRKSGTHPELVPPPQAPRAQASPTPLACQPKVALACFQEDRAQCGLLGWHLDISQKGISRLLGCLGDSGSPRALDCPASCSGFTLGLWAKGQHLDLSGNGHRRDTGIWRSPSAEAIETEWLVCTPVGLQPSGVITMASAIGAANVHCPSIPDSPTGPLFMK